MHTSIRKVALWVDFVSDIIERDDKEIIELGINFFISLFNNPGPEPKSKIMGFLGSLVISLNMVNAKFWYRFGYFFIYATNPLAIESLIFNFISLL